MSDATAVAEERTAFATLGEALENAAEYLSSAGAAAGSSVKSAAGKTGEVVGAGAYKASYGVSFGVVFGAVFLKELLPTGSAVRRGFEDGADAAFDAVEARKTRVAEAKKEAAAPKKPSARKTVKAIPQAD